MVPNWLKKSQRQTKRHLPRESPPIKITRQETLPPCSFASLSLFQTNRSPDSCLNYFGTSNNGKIIHLGLLTPALSKRNGRAFRKIGADSWVQQTLADPHWLDSADALGRWLARLQGTLTDFGGGTLSASFQGISLDSESRTVHIYLCGLAGIVLQDADAQIKHIPPDPATGLIGTLTSRLPSAISVPWDCLASLVVASDDFQRHQVEESVGKIKQLPYPKAGAAELLFFELQKREKGSSVLWVDF